jgi:hypothetical protein
MLGRRTLLQLTTRLAIGLGALFLVGVLLAAIPNHRAPVVAGASTQASQDTQVADPATAPGIKMNAAKSREKNAMQGEAHGNVTTAKAGESAK